MFLCILVCVDGFELLVQHANFGREKELDQNMAVRERLMNLFWTQK